MMAFVALGGWRVLTETVTSPNLNFRGRRSAIERLRDGSVLVRELLH